MILRIQNARLVRQFLFLIQSEELNIAVSTVYRRLNHATNSKSKSCGGTVDLPHYANVFLRIPNNASAANFTASHLELRLNQCDQATCLS